MAESIYRSTSPYRVGRGRSLEDLLGADAASLYRANQQLAGLEAQAGALGIEGGGQGARGFLTSTLDYITRPQSAAMGFLSGLLGRTQEGEPTGAFERALAGLRGQERFTGSELIGGTPEGAGAVQRGARAVTGFGLDVLTDPLTYLTLGRGGYLRGAGAAAATEAQVGRAARNVLSEVPSPQVTPKPPVEAATALETASTRALTRAERIRQGESPVVRFGDEPTFATQAPEVRPVLPTFRERAQLPELPGAAGRGVATETNDEFITRLSQAAGEGQALVGGRGVKDALQRTLSERFDPAEANRIADKILSGTTGEVRGGLGIRLPFLGRDAAGRVVPAGEAVTRRFADLTPGSGTVLDEAGFRGMAEAARKVFNEYRSSGFYRTWSKTMNGRFGAEYADFIRNATKGTGGMDYKTFTKLVANDNARTAALLNRNIAASAAIQTAEKMVREAPNSEEAAAAFKRYYMMADDMVLEPGASESSQAAFQAAAALREHTEGMFDEVLDRAAAAGVEVGNQREFVRNFIARPITAAEKKWRRERGLPVSEYSAIKKRRIGTETDEYGRAEATPNDQLNQRFIDQKLRPAGHEVFETDPLKIAAQQMASYSEAVNMLSLIADLKATGLLVERTTGAVELLNVPAAVRKGARVEEALANVGDRLGIAMQKALDDNNTAAIDEISAAIEKVASDGNTIRTMLSKVDSTDPNSVRVVGDLMRVLKSALASGEAAGVQLTAAQKEALFSRKGLVSVRGTGGNAEQLLRSGLQPVGGTEGVRLPRGLANLYADETVKDAVEKYFLVESGGFRDTKWFNDVYQPLYSLMKQYLTVGRPGGYHLRNLQGAWWNNYLGDVSALDHKLSASILTEGTKAKKSAQTAIENIRAGKASGLTGEADNIARAIVDLGVARGSKVVDYEVTQLADFLVSQRLSAIKVGDTNLADIMVAANNQGIGRNGRRLEYLRDQARLEGVDMTEAIMQPDRINLFRGRSEDELGSIGTAMNKAANFRWIHASGDVADVTENYVRMAAFISGARRYGISDGGTAAGYLTKALQFDYADLSDFERNVMKNIIPFYTWTRRNLPLQFFALLNQPGKFNKLDFAKENLQSQFGAQGDEEGLNQVIPQWMQEKMGFATQFITPGGPVAIAGPGFEAPAFDLNRYLQVGNPTEVIGRVRDEAVSAMNPLAKALIENISGVDTFTGAAFPEDGVASPFGNVPIPGSFVIDGERRVNAEAYNALKDLVPPVGAILRLSGRGNDADRILTNWLSTIGGAPTSTLSTGQIVAELRTRQDRLDSQIDRTAGALGVDREWLRGMVDQGLNADEIRALIAGGNGKFQRPTE